MDKKPLIGVSILAVVLLVLGSLSNVVGYQTQETGSQSSTSRGTWLYVGGSGPGNYTRIQDAIDNASDGDTVFVYDDSSPYYESLMINTSINVTGEKKETTVIDGKNEGTIIQINVDKVNLNGFTIQNSHNSSHSEYDHGIYIEANFVNIYENIIKAHNDYGIFIFHSTRSAIYSNIIYDTDLGICLYETNNCIVKNNSIRGGRAIWNGESSNNELSYNTIESAGLGIHEDYSKKTSIIYNKINNCTTAIYILCSEYTNITLNNFYLNRVNLEINIVYGLIIERNNFIGKLKHQPLHNTWFESFDSNYWGQPRSFPKMLYGNWDYYPPLINLISPYFWFSIPLPEFKFDWHPAQEPYDIPGMR